VKGNAAKALLKNHPWLAKFFPMVSANGQALKTWLKHVVNGVKIAPLDMSPAAMRPREDKLFRGMRFIGVEKTLFHLVHHEEGEHAHSRTSAFTNPEIDVATAIQLLQAEAKKPLTVDAVVKQVSRRPFRGLEFTIYKP